MSKKSKKNKLKVDKSFKLDKLKLIGIVSDLEDYRLAWLINQEFHWDLELRGKVYDKEGELCYSRVEEGVAEESADILKFPIFRFIEEEVKYEVSLIKNKIKNRLHIKSLKQFDYLLGLEGEFVYLPTQMLDRIKKFSQVQMVVDISSEMTSENYILLSYK
ncbi:MAG: IPExxxVDY family protein [Chitinophagales bacterium]|nr:IPExxxVDY family protein [Chitinophagales bacterium]